MIKNEQEYRVTLERIERFQRQVEQLRKVEPNAENYRLSASGSTNSDQGPYVST